MHRVFMRFVPRQYVEEISPGGLQSLVLGDAVARSVTIIRMSRPAAAGGCREEPHAWPSPAIPC